MCQALAAVRQTCPELPLKASHSVLATIPSNDSVFYPDVRVFIHVCLFRLCADV